MRSKQVLLKLAAAGSVQDASRGLTGEWAVVAVVTIALCLKADHSQMLRIACKFPQMSPSNLVSAALADI